LRDGRRERAPDPGVGPADPVGFYARGSLDGLRPGDVLLYHGCDVFARAIQHFDASPYYHAALVLDRGLVGEAVMAEGISSRPLAESFRHREWAVVRRYRNDLLAGDGAGLRPVVACAEDLVAQGQRYAHEQLLPLALLLLTRKVPRTASFGKVVVGVLEAVGSRLRRQPDLIGRHRDLPMVCSGFVAHCFARAGLEASKARLRVGVARDGLLAEVLSRPMLGLDIDSSPRRGLGPTPAGGSGDPLESWLRIYLDEAQGPPRTSPTRGPLAGPPPEDVHAAVLRFAQALSDVAGDGPGDVARRPTRGVSARGRRTTAVLTQLAAIADHLVTPGDLGRAVSLTDVGLIRALGA